MERLPIYIICGKNPLTTYSGYSSYAYNLAKVLTASDYPVSIFCIGLEKQTVDSPIGKIYQIKSKVVHLLFKEAVMAALVFVSPALIFEIRRVIKNDLKVVIWAVGLWGLPGVILKFLYPKRVIFLADYFTTLKHEYSGVRIGTPIVDYGLKRWIKNGFIWISIIQIYDLFERLILRVADKIITHYQSTEEILGSSFNLNRNKFFRLPYFVDFKEIKNRKNFTLKPLSCLIICRQEGTKGINTLLRALLLIQQDKIDCQTAIVGEGGLLKSNIKLAGKLKLKNVKFYGPVDDVGPFFKSKPIYVFPSTEAGSSALSLIEAMKEGLPIITTDVDGIKEDLKNNFSAIFIKPNDPTGLSESIEQLLNYPKLAKKLGNNAQKQYYAKFNFKLIVQEYKKTFPKLIHG